MNGMNPEVDFYFIQEKKWQQELEKLRNSEIDINIEKLSISEFKDSSGKDLDISPNIFTKIDSIMEE